MNRVALVVLILATIAFSYMPSWGQLNCSGGPLSCGGSSAIIGLTTNAATFNELLYVGSATQAITGIESIGDLNLRYTKRANGTAAARTILSNGNIIDRDQAMGWDGSAYRLSSEIERGVDAATGASLIPGNIKFYTTDTSGNRVLALMINSAQVVTAGVTVTAGTTSTVTITTANLNFRGNSVLKDGLPTCSGAGCVVVANSINSAGRVTTTTTGAADITITFSTAFTNAPVCTTDNETTGNLLRATTLAAGSFHIQGTTVTGDTLAWICFGN